MNGAQKSISGAVALWRDERPIIFAWGRMTFRPGASDIGAPAFHEFVPERSNMHIGLIVGIGPAAT